MKALYGLAYRANELWTFIINRSREVPAALPVDAIASTTTPINNAIYKHLAIKSRSRLPAMLTTRNNIGLPGRSRKR